MGGSNFKPGSGDLDFGDDEDEGDSQDTTEEGSEKSRSEGTETENSRTHQESTEHSEYPYFIRRNNVGDERDNRLEIFVRDKVRDQEPSFRSELADILDVGEISKTDAREFALLAAYEHPEKVAKLMEDEGFNQ
jgi:hypothetical protein